MNGGDPVIGGDQVTPGSSPQPTPGPQPATSANSSTDATSSVLEISHDSPAHPVSPEPVLSHTPIDSVIPSIDVSLDGPTDDLSSTSDVPASLATPDTTAVSDISLDSQPTDAPDHSDASAPAPRPADIPATPAASAPANSTSEPSVPAPTPTAPASTLPGNPPANSTGIGGAPTLQQPDFGSFSTPAAASAPISSNTPQAPFTMAPTSVPVGMPQPMSPMSPTPSQVVFSDTPTSAPAQPPRSKKPLIIALACLVLAAVIALTVFVATSLMSGQSSNNSSQSSAPQVLSTKKEVYDTLWGYNRTYYSTLIEAYNLNIGLIPNFKMSNDNILFPAESYASNLSQKVDEAEDAYNEILPTLPDEIASDSIDLSQVKTSIGDSLQALKQNSDLISEFYDAYIAPLINDSRPSTCSKTSAMSILEQYPTATAADKYYTVYCTALNYLNTISGTPTESEMLSLQQLVAIPASEAAAALNSLLVDVPSATSAINRLFEEFTQ